MIKPLADQSAQGLDDRMEAEDEDRLFPISVNAGQSHLTPAATSTITQEQSNVDSLGQAIQHPQTTITSNEQLNPPIGQRDVVMSWVNSIPNPMSSGSSPMTPMGGTMAGLPAFDSTFHPYGGNSYAASAANDNYQGYNLVDVRSVKSSRRN
jgi:hypothetical protein